MAGTQLTTAQQVGLGALSGILGALQGEDATPEAKQPTASETFQVNLMKWLPVIAVGAVALYFLRRR